ADRQPARTLAVEHEAGLTAIAIQPAPPHLAVEPLERAEEGVVPGDAAPDTRGRIDRQRLRFAEQQQAEAMVEIAARQHDAGDRGMAGAPRVKRGEAFDLEAKIRRSVQQVPVLAVSADGKAFLASRLGAN